MIQTSMSLYAPRSSKICFPAPLSSASITVSVIKITRAVRTTRTRCTEQDDRPCDIMLLKSSAQRKRDTDARHRDQVVSARMADPRQRVHFRIYADGPAPALIFIFSAPGRTQAEIMPGHGEATRGHELGQPIMRVSIRSSTCFSWCLLRMNMNYRTVPRIELRGDLKSSAFGGVFFLSRYCLLLLTMNVQAQLP